MLEVKEAVSRAKEEISSLFPDFVSNDLRLEEAETPLSGGRWKFTFSASLPQDGASTSSLVDILRARRTRKTVELESESGFLVSIKAA